MDTGRAATLVALLIVVGCSSSAPSGTATVAPPTRTSAPPSAAPQQPTQAAQRTSEPTSAATSAPSASSPAQQSPAAGPANPLIPSDLALYGTGLVPDGWQVVEEATGACRIAAPPDWSTDLGPGTAQAGLVAALAAVSATTEDWETYKDTVDQLYLTGHVTLIDTDEVFLIANPATSEFDLGYVLLLRRDGVNCHLVMTVQRNAIPEHGGNAIVIGQTLDRAD